MRRRQRISNLRAGLIAIVVIGAVCYLVFGGSLPFSGSSFVLKAMFTSETQMHIPSPVRIAGVDVGSVTGIERVSKSSNAAVVTMTINSNGLPIHADATAKIRPRIFLEGNFYVDLQPGTPSAPVLQSGQLLPASHTAGPVQLDRVLSSLNAAARSNLQTLLQGYGGALNDPSTPLQDATHDPSVRGLTAAEALNLSLKYSVAAFRDSAIVNEGLLGLAPHDLSGVVKGNEQVFRGLAAADGQLPSLITTFNATMATLASRQQALSQTIALLPPVLRSTNAANKALDASFPPTRQFAAEILPGINQLGPTISAALPWIAQAQPLVSKQELGGLLTELTPAVQNTASSLSSTETLISNADLLARCFSHNIIPAGNQVIKDPPLNNTQQVYQELFQSAVGIASAAGNFDGNGRYVRSSAGGGEIRAQTPSIPGNGPLYGNFIEPPLGTRPAFGGSPPPTNRSVACYRNSVPNLNDAATGAGP